MVTIRAGWRPALQVATVLFAIQQAPGRPRAEGLPALWEPNRAIDFLNAPAHDGEPAPSAAAPRWNGALGQGIVRTLFGSYRVVLSSQDLPLCGFSPSCSRFSQRAVDRCGFVNGALLSLDRLLRDHPLANAFYPSTPTRDGPLLLDEPDRYCAAPHP